MFQQIERSFHLPEKVANAIRKKIEAEELVPGERLPAELALAKTFGVSRSVIREAIAKLRSQGLVETRHGIGAFVLSNISRPSLKLEIVSPPEPENLTRLFQLRLPLEMQASRLAAGARTDQGLSAIHETVYKMKAVGDWLESGIGTDIAFHLAIAEATGNPFYTDILSSLLSHIGCIIPVAFSWTADADIAAMTFEEHNAIYQRIADKDADGAERSMAYHVIKSAQRLGVSASDLAPGYADKNLMEIYIGRIV